MKKILAISVLLISSVTAGLVVADRAQAAPGNCTSNTATDPSVLSGAGLTASGKLVCFTVDAPTSGAVVGNLTGFTGSDTSLVGIDYRVQDGLLYGVGNGGGLYKINTATAVLTPLANGISVALDGTAFGVDFNPAANALRVVSDTGQNLRITTLDTTPVTTVDTSLTSPPTVGTTLGIVGAGYTNNDLNTATATTLFDLNTTTNAVMIQSPANSGQLVNTGTFAPDAVNGDLDVYTTATARNEGYALVVTPSETRLWTVDLLTGALRAGKRATGLVDIALPINQ